VQTISIIFYKEEVMSFWGTFDSFFSKVKAEIVRVFGSATTEQAVNAAFTVIEPLVVGVVAMAAGPAIGAATAAVMSRIQASYATVSTIIQSGIPTTGTSLSTALQNGIADLQDNFGALLTDAGVKNSAKYKTIEVDANLILNELSAIAKELAPSTAAQPVAAVKA